VITVIGQDAAALPAAARRRVESAGLIAGPARSLAAVDAPPGARQVATDDVSVVLDEIDAAHPPRVPATGRDLAVVRVDVVVLASGDPGYFGIVRALRERGHEPEVLPAVPSVALAFARAGLPWDDAMVVSAHGGHLRRAVNACRAHPKVAVLTGPGAGPAELARELAPQNPRAFVVCEDLGGPRERVTHCRPAEATTRPWRDPVVVLVLDPLILDPGREAGVTRWAAGPAGGPAGWALPDNAFGDRAPPVTRAEVRAVALARLGPGVGDMVWDIGAGSGSVAIECARFGAAVIAVDRDPGSCARIRDNVRAHRVRAAVARGEAPAVLGHLPDPDAVFVGGGGPDVVAACASRALRSVVVEIHAAERVRPCLEALGRGGLAAEAVRLEVGRVAPRPVPGAPAPATDTDTAAAAATDTATDTAAAVDRGAAFDPVFVVWGTR
jgi:precorrin-6Y C5,15-methyltransferase (decarboxylating)